MVGIVSWNAYVPFYRLDYKDIANAWKTRLPEGERTVANYDEDSITMAVEAGMNCLGGIDRNTIDSLYYASTTSPYKEKQSAALVSEALDLRRDTISMDFANSLRSGTNAILAGINAIKANSAKKILVTAADCRIATPQSTLEPTFGDGAVALLLGESDIVAEAEGSYSICDEMLDWWRFNTDAFVKTWEDRFVLGQGYLSVVSEAVFGFMKKFGLSVKDFNKIACYAPDRRNHERIAKTLGFDYKAQFQDSLIGKVGDAGSANALMHLAAALEEAKVGDKILLVSYGDGCDVLSLRVTENIEKIKENNQGTIKKSLAKGRKLASYEKYLAYRNILAVDVSRRAPYPSSASVVWRERDQIIRYHAFKCQRCGAIQLPRPDKVKVCVKCQSMDGFNGIRLSDVKGTINAFAQDYIFATIDPPAIQVVINFEGGGRVLGYLTDAELDKVKVGAPIKMSFRHISDAGGFRNYYWKAKLIY